MLTDYSSLLLALQLTSSDYVTKMAPVRYFCTYFDSNYLVRALPMIESLRQNCDGEFKMFALCLDDKVYEILNTLALDGIVPVALHDLENADGDLKAIKTNRSRVEYYFTCTSCFLRYLFDKYLIVDLLTYVDADLFFYSSVASIFEEMGPSSILIIPHRFPSRLRDNERFGLYNVGLLTLRRNKEGLQCVDWWRTRCLEWCFDRFEDGKFADQKYLDRWPELFPKVCIVQHAGAGLAPWNVERHKISRVGGRMFVDGQPLIFYHFQGYQQLSIHYVDAALSYAGFLFDTTVIRHIHLPYVETVMRARDSLKSRGAALQRGVGSTRDSVVGEYDSLSWAYKFRRFLESRTILYYGSRAWYCDSRIVHAVISIYDKVRGRSVKRSAE